MSKALDATPVRSSVPPQSPSKKTSDANSLDEFLSMPAPESSNNMEVDEDLEITIMPPPSLPSSSRRASLNAGSKRAGSPHESEAKRPREVRSRPCCFVDSS